ncbi:MULTISPECIES: hypothetical protein [Ralstonia solanacearum species complex]|uniref:hypothetical protein n=1 Tax=Ralstonia solanacearum species complex TaxID=3116862 RepID=UPI000E56B552|nr:hypothetical protein [Ralstonia solanacearum]BEU74255.1 hypothetical protein MAFF211271_38100 [Ralstonia pseudosolanacearum]AXV79139.1 hypothetical protein CJO76_19400 [Ralstonia solanacearum]AXV93160.1 hypothetical protein CJO79_19385 [Ralstonia solanacearum]AXW21211.1 hypothetical protein CJO85_19455 [Ralstonia solanacearum]AXW78057.1 hypothetical protein CJO97_19380 [Ralstonia solanacearum]
MSAPLYPQEIYLLERYTSVEYFGAMRDAWQAMVDHVEDCLARFMAKLPADYRSRPLPLQPDIAWGQRVLPNFRQTALHLDDCFIRLTHHDYSALLAATSVTGGVRGQRDFSADWLDEVQPGAAARYEELLYLAHQYAINIDNTAYARWKTTLLSTHYDANYQGPLDAPSTWPRYELDPKLQVRTTEPVIESGTYLSDLDDTSAQFLTAGMEAPMAMVGFDGQQYISKAPALWTRVRRVEGATVADGLADLLPQSRHRPSGRAPGGDACPRTGWWFTPAAANSRRHFQQGDVMPIVTSDYGSAIWQWDADQGEPKL